jgi:hypothetical protein
MVLGVLADGDNAGGARILVDARIGPLVQRPRVGRAAGHPALLANGLRRKFERQAGEGRARLAVIDAVDAVVLPDYGRDLGRSLAPGHAEVVMGDVDDGRAQ